MERKTIAIIYHSQGLGMTRASADLLAQGVREAGGFEVVLKNTNERRLDPTVLEQYAGVAVGTPDYFGYPAGGLKMFMDDWLVARRAGNRSMEGIPVALFMTHAGTGRARKRHEFTTYAVHVDAPGGVPPGQLHAVAD